MAADQWRKRLNSAGVVGFHGREQYRAKRKNTGLPQYDPNMKSHISLEWDGNQKRVVARRDQISISRRDMWPFMRSSPSVNNPIADVFSVPQEIYTLENLNDVLSYEVWETYLSESERNHLMQFLPRGPEAEEVLEALLAGDNFHFGSPFLNWSASLCAGDLHPDAIFQKEQCLKTEKKAYNAELHKYHNNMIGYLLKLKERFENCKDPEKEIVQKIWRSRNDTDKRISSSANDSRFCVPEDNIAASSESCSWVADEKACSSDNQNSSMLKGGELQNRKREKGSLKGKSGNPSVVSDDVLNVGLKSRKGDKRHLQNITCSDGAKYMSYFKVSKKQHDIVKNMKGKSIQSKSLNRVLGNIESINVQPYELFIKEEQKKLREYWIHLANKALPAAYANWRDLHSQRQQMRESLEQELNEKLKMTTEVKDDEDSESDKSIHQDHIEDGVKDNTLTLVDDEKSISDSPGRESQQHLQSDEEFDGMDVDTGKCIITESDHGTLNAPEYSGDANTADVAISQGVDLSCSGDVWPAGNISHSYYDSAASHEYTSDDGLSIAHPKANEEQQTHLIDLESNLQVEDAEKDIVHRQPEDTSFRRSDDGSFGSYSDQDRNELFQSLFKGQGMMYHHEQKQTTLDFQSPNDMLIEEGRFHGHFQEQSHPSLPMEQGQKRENDVYLQQRVSENIYSDGGRFLIPRQETLAPVDAPDWVVNSVPMAPPPIQPHLNGDMQNWFSSEHQVRGGWVGSGGASVPSRSIGSRNGGDQSLYSVLSQCNQLRASSPYQSAASTEQFISSRNYGMMGGGATPSISNVLPQPTHSLDYMSGREAAPSLMPVPDDMGWMGLPHQNSGLRDPMGKPYLRPWNQ
ncbi:uncharacterized protein LOC21390955 [Morus notabilis]|uniref:uncharacterized protein LOC21390955 n=1 Tax=Morus notabilis TaxID=981085 RepID=UPI000CED42A9|nr:uncharacterized protein LOC21390955 [Morus notabilis]